MAVRTIFSANNAFIRHRLVRWRLFLTAILFGRIERRSRLYGSISMDMILIVLGIAFFIAAYSYIKACDSL